jgi:glycosyltransferase involved in cell wall biosynthesis
VGALPSGPAHVSVVVPVYNAEATLPALLASLAGQDCRERYEVVVVDDCSTDASVAVARDFARDLPLVVCEGSRRRGSAAARNAGAARAHAPILAFCDADDIAHEAWLRFLCEAIDHHPLVAGGVHHLTADAAGPPASVIDEQGMDPGALTAYYDHLPWTMTANLGLRRDAFADVGGFAEQLRTASDADLCWRLAERGVALAYEPAAIVFKRHRSGAIPTFRQYLTYGEEHPLLFRRHRGAGMPRRSLPNAARRYAETATSVARGLRHPRSPAVVWAAARLGQDLGRLLGSVRWRSLYL